LLKTKIPLKRSAQQRQQQKNLNNSDCSDDNDKDANKDDSDYDDEVEKEAYKRQNDGADGLSLVNVDLQSSIFKSIEASKNLPIAKHKASIMQKLERNRVLIISGDTGCGKTTQVPKFILEVAMSQKTDVKIICT